MLTTQDAKVKIWNVASGYCFVTFSEHQAPVTAVKFVGHGSSKAILSSSLDGTVRAHDLLRYKNFRTLTSPVSMYRMIMKYSRLFDVLPYYQFSVDPSTIYHSQCRCKR